MRAVVPLGMGGVVTKRECEGCWKVLVLIWYWLPRCVYLVKTRWAVLIWWTHSSVRVLCFIQALWKLLRFDIALFLSCDGCDSDARVWRSACTFFPSVASSFLSDCTPAEVHMCACARAHTWARARAHTHTHTHRSRSHSLSWFICSLYPQLIKLVSSSHLLKLILWKHFLSFVKGIYCKNLSDSISQTLSNSCHPISLTHTHTQSVHTQHTAGQLQVLSHPTMDRMSVSPPKLKGLTPDMMLFRGGALRRFIFRWDQCPHKRKEMWGQDKRKPSIGWAEGPHQNPKVGTLISGLQPPELWEINIYSSRITLGTKRCPVLQWHSSFLRIKFKSLATSHSWDLAPIPWVSLQSSTDTVAHVPHQSPSYFSLASGPWPVSSAWTSNLHTDGQVPSIQGQHHQGYLC